MPLDDPANLNFRATRRPRTVSRSSSWKWWVFALVAAVAFVLIIRALLARTAWTAGPSPDVATSQPLPAYEEPVVRYDDVPVASVPMVYRCVDGAGGVSLQSQPCGPGQRMTKAVPAPPDVEPVRRPVVTRSPVYANNRNSYWSSPTERERQQARCAEARAQRDRALERIGLKRTYDLLRRLDESVARACKGV